MCHSVAWININLSLNHLTFLPKFRKTFTSFGKPVVYPSPIISKPVPLLGFTLGSETREAKAPSRIFTGSQPG
jgi:hypothetical protein